MKTIEADQTPGAVRRLMAGVSELSRGNEQAALETFVQALDGDATVGALCSARLYILRHDHEGAESTLAALIAREPGLAEAHYLMGTVHRSWFRTPAAILSFREAVRLDPAHARAASELRDLLDVQDP